jgi:hypothetical protein
VRWWQCPWSSFRATIAAAAHSPTAANSRPAVPAAVLGPFAALHPEIATVASSAAAALIRLVV